MENQYIENDNKKYNLCLKFLEELFFIKSAKWLKLLEVFDRHNNYMEKNTGIKKV